MNWGGRKTANQTNIFYCALKRGIYGNCVYFSSLHLFIVSWDLPGNSGFLLQLYFLLQKIYFISATFIPVKHVFSVHYHILYILFIWDPKWIWISKTSDTFYNFHRHRVSARWRIRRMPGFNILLVISGSVIYHNLTTTRTSQMILLGSIFSRFRFSLVCCQINIIQKNNDHCVIHLINFLGLHCHFSFSSLPSYAVMLF